MGTVRYPFDYDNLKKGDEIPVEQLEHITRTKYGDDKYSLRVLSLCEQIERELKERGRHVTVVQRKGAIRILLDSEAAEYNSMRFRQQQEGLVRSHYRGLAVVSANLDETERKRHERRMENQSKILQGMIAGGSRPVNRLLNGGKKSLLETQTA